MRRALAFFAVLLLLVGPVAAVLWVHRNVDDPRVLDAERLPWIGLLVWEIRRYGKPLPPDPFQVPGEVKEEDRVYRERRPSWDWPWEGGGGSRQEGAPAAADLPGERERVRRVRVREGTSLHAEPTPSAPVVASVARLSYLVVLDRGAGWVKVLYGEDRGWLPDPDWTGTEPPLGSAPDPVKPVAPRAPDADRLARARARLAPPETVDRFGDYTVYTDLRDGERLRFLDRLSTQLETLYSERYGRGLVGRPAEAVVIFARESDYRSFQNEDTELAGLPASGHSGYGLVFLFDGGRPGGEVAATLVHEMAHLLNRRGLGPALPSWLDEGIADDLSQSRVDAAGRIVPGTLGGVTIRTGNRITMYGARAALHQLAEAIDGNRLRPLAELLDLDWGSFVRREGNLNYAQSSFFVRYLLDAEDKAHAAAFRAFLSDVAAGTPPAPEALRAKLGRSWEELDTGFRQWILAQREDL